MLKKANQQLPKPLKTQNVILIFITKDTFPKLNSFSKLYDTLQMLAERLSQTLKTQMVFLLSPQKTLFLN